MATSKKALEREISLAGVGVKIPKKENFNFALKVFKRKLKESGKLKEFSRRREYIKPSVRRRKQRLDAIRRQKFER